MTLPALQLQSWSHATGVPWLRPDADRTGPPLVEATLLVVDDDARVRRLTARMLREEGYRVVEAGSAFEALELLERERDIRLVVTDVVMPGMHGIQLAERIGALHPGRWVVLTSGYAPICSSTWACARRVFRCC